MSGDARPPAISNQWCTPPDILASVREVFDGAIGLDPCSNADSTVNARIEYRLPEHDGLVEAWNAPTIFVNPPYGYDRQRRTRILHWFERMSQAARDGAEVIALVPVATNTTHWKVHVFGVASAVCFLSAPRLRFYRGGVADAKGAPMACAVLYYGSSVDAFAAAFSPHGAVLDLRPLIQA